MYKLVCILVMGVFLSGCSLNRSQSVPFSSLKSPVPSVVVQKPQDVRLLFGGDMMFDRSIRLSIQKNGESFILFPLHTLFHQYDAVIANLEGPITSNPSKSVNSAIGSRNNYIFTFAPTTAQLLKEENIGIVNIGNNHITNFGEDGVTQTRMYLEQENISYFGNTGENKEKRYVILEKNGIKIGFINYNQFVSNGMEALLEDIDVVSEKADVVIVYTHWGSEYLAVAGEGIQEQAHQFIDRGADLIIGSHPHVVQQKEVYQGKTIYYSLGNFVFDQYFQKETQEGLLVEVIIKQDSYEIETQEIPILLKQTGQTMHKDR